MNITRLREKDEVTKKVFHCFYGHIYKVDFVILKIEENSNLIIDIIDQFVAPNRRVIEEPKDVLAFNLCHLLIFFSI